MNIKKVVLTIDELDNFFASTQINSIISTNYIGGVFILIIYTEVE